MVDRSKLERLAAELASKVADLQDRIDDRVDDHDPEVAEELARLEAELAALEEEERRLDGEFASAGGSRSSWRDSEGDTWTRDIGDVIESLVERATSRLSDVTGAMVGGTLGRASDVVELREVHGGGPVAIHNRAGRVEVRRGDADVVRVTAERFAPNDEHLAEIRVDVAAVDDGVEVHTDWPGSTGWRRQVVLTVEVPVGTEVEARTNGGSVDIHDVAGPATARTRGGSVRVSGAVGAVDAETAGGSIRVNDHDGEVAVRTMGGSIRLAGHLRGRVQASTSGGSVRIEGVRDAAVEASTSGGSIRVDGRLRGDSTIRTAGGSVSLALAPDANLVVDGEGSSAKSEFDGVRAERGSLRGQVGTGDEGRVELRTSGGSVSLRRG